MDAERNGRQLAAILEQLTPDQIRWVIARMECDTDKEAAARVGISHYTVARWPERVKRAVTLMHRDGLVTAIHLRRKALAKAMSIKVAGLDSRDQRVRQQVATEIIEWELGKATTPMDVQSGGQPLAALLGELRRTLTAEDDDGEDA